MRCSGDVDRRDVVPDSAFTVFRASCKRASGTSPNCPNNNFILIKKKNKVLIHSHHNHKNFLSTRFRTKFHLNQFKTILTFFFFLPLSLSFSLERRNKSTSVVHSHGR